MKKVFLIFVLLMIELFFGTFQIPCQSLRKGFSPIESHRFFDTVLVIIVQKLTLFLEVLGAIFKRIWGINGLEHRLGGRSFVLLFLNRHAHYFVNETFIGLRQTNWFLLIKVDPIRRLRSIQIQLSLLRKIGWLSFREHFGVVPKNLIS